MVPLPDLNCKKIQIEINFVSNREEQKNLVQTKTLTNNENNESAFKINLIFIFGFGARIKASKPKQTTKCIPIKYFILYSVFMIQCKKKTTKKTNQHCSTSNK